MIALDFSEQIAALRATFEDIRAVIGQDRLVAEIAQLSEQASAPDLWDDTENAQKVTSALSHRQSELEKLETTEQRLDDLEVLVEMANDGDDQESADEAHSELKALQKMMDTLEVQTPP
jgi:peptide chain release factor 2